MSRSRTASCILIAVALTGGAVSALPPAAGGQAAAPTVTIEGQAVVGSTLIAVWQPIDPTVTIEYRWQRCTGDVRSSCDRIPGAATVSSYTVTAPDDVGRRLAVRAVSTGAGAAWSPLTDVVTVPPVPTPTPTPEPTPDPTPTPTPTPDPDPEPRPRDDDPPTFDQSGPPSPPPATPTPIASGSEEPPRLLRPFPVVRVKGTLLRGGARISLMRVRAPSTATVDVRCNGPRCRVRERSFGSGRIAALERFLRAGTRITIRVSKPNAVGKYVRIVIRDGTAPERRDACLLPGSGKAVDCPKA